MIYGKLFIVQTDWVASVEIDLKTFYCTVFHLSFMTVLHSVVYFEIQIECHVIIQFAHGSCLIPANFRIELSGIDRDNNAMSGDCTESN